jgi:hypothetical protein
MPYPPESENKTDGADRTHKEDPAELPKKPFRFTLFPKLSAKPAESKPYDWGWLWDWSDLLFLFPIALVGFLTASTWIRKFDPTAQVLSVENLTVLNWNLMVLFGSSGIIFLLWKIWVGGKVFGREWDKGLSVYERAKLRLAFLAGLATYVAFILTRNL